MLDFLLRYDDEDDGKYKKEMMEMLKNKDKKERNVLETYITKDIGNVFFFCWTCSFLHFVTSDLAERFLDHHISRYSAPLYLSLSSFSFLSTAMDIRIIRRDS